MANKTWYLGLDIGSASVGWAATDTEYKIIRKNKFKMRNSSGRGCFKIHKEIKNI